MWFVFLKMAQNYCQIPCCNADTLYIVKQHRSSVFLKVTEQSYKTNNLSVTVYWIEDHPLFDFP